MTTETKVHDQQGLESTRPEGDYYRPAVDIVETPDELLLIADIPGAKSDTIDINFEDGVLAIRGKVPRRQDESVTYLLREYGLGDFYRNFRVSEEVDSNRIYAEFADGVLKVHLPKVEEAKPRKIEVRSAT
jgi:HSP20 family protein